jgi:hypothetical protein
LFHLLDSIISQDLHVKEGFGTSIYKARQDLLTTQTIR